MEFEQHLVIVTDSLRMRSVLSGLVSSEWLHQSFAGIGGYWLTFVGYLLPAASLIPAMMALVGWQMEWPAEVSAAS